MNFVLLICYVVLLIFGGVVKGVFGWGFEVFRFVFVLKNVYSWYFSGFVYYSGSSCLFEKGIDGLKKKRNKGKEKEKLIKLFILLY